MFASKPVWLTVTLRMCHVLPVLLNLPQSKVISQSNRSSFIYLFCHSWCSFREIANIYANNVLFFFFKAVIPQVGIYGWVLFGNGKTSSTRIWEIAVLLGPRALLFVEHLKFSQKAFSSILFSSCKKLYNDFPKQKRILPTNRQTNASNANKPYVLHRIKQQFSHSISSSHIQRKCYDPFPQEFLISSSNSPLRRIKY